MSETTMYYEIAAQIGRAIKHVDVSGCSCCDAVRTVLRDAPMPTVTEDDLRLLSPGEVVLWLRGYARELSDRGADDGSPAARAKAATAAAAVRKAADLFEACRR